MKLILFVTQNMQTIYTYIYIYTNKIFINACFIKNASTIEEFQTIVSPWTLITGKRQLLENVKIDLRHCLDNVIQIVNKIKR